MLAALLLAACGPRLPWQPAASLDGATISMKDYQARLTLLEELHAKQSGGSKPIPLSKSEELRLEDEAIAGLVDEALLHQEAERRHLAVTPADVKQQIDAVRKLFKTQADFNQALAGYGYSPDQLNSQLFARLTEVRVENTLADDRIKKAAAALKAGAQLTDVVRQYSDLPGSSPIGQLDLNPSDQTSIDPAVKPAIDALSPGQTSDPVKGVNGWYILHLVSRAPDDLQVDVVYVFAPDATHYRTQDRPPWFLTFLAGLEHAAHVHYYVGSRAS
jgi:hypothetical protein